MNQEEAVPSETKRNLANRSELKRKGRAISTAGIAKFDAQENATTLVPKNETDLRDALNEDTAKGVHAMKRCLHLKLRAKNLLRAIDTQ